jgi:hypothetical protein
MHTAKLGKGKAPTKTPVPPLKPPPRRENDAILIFPSIIWNDYKEAFD